MESEKKDAQMANDGRRGDEKYREDLEGNREESKRQIVVTWDG